ncbi:hypothetical protein SK128_000589 [Halocaridina rubra]|uniref:Uncharacterized protein n=1 Tax=Halocaridina rubra TaxID=373956 RepID=A0AAN8XVK8_HALRR
MIVRICDTASDVMIAFCIITHPILEDLSFLYNSQHITEGRNYHMSPKQLLESGEGFCVALSYLVSTPEVLNSRLRHDSDSNDDDDNAGSDDSDSDGE